MRILIVLIIAGFAATASAQTYESVVITHKRKTAPTPPVRETKVNGVLVRAARGGNPLQMLNPGAPAKYGTAEESVVFDPEIPGKWKGIKLLSFNW